MYQLYFKKEKERKIRGGQVIYVPIHSVDWSFGCQFSGAGGEDLVSLKEQKEEGLVWLGVVLAVDHW